jgi:hypothetical protein
VIGGGAEGDRVSIATEGPGVTGPSAACRQVAVLSENASRGSGHRTSGSGVADYQEADMYMQEERMTRGHRRYDAVFGPLKVLRIFFPGRPRPWTAPELSHDRSVVVSFKLLPSEVLDGRHDAAMGRWFATAPRNHPVWWVYWHEPEDDIRDGRFTAADYRAAFAHLDALADRASNPMLRTTQVLMGWTLDPASGRDWRTYDPGASVIDVQAWDQHDHVNETTCVYRSMSAHEARRAAYAITRAEGVRIPPLRSP